MQHQGGNGAALSIPKERRNMDKEALKTRVEETGIPKTVIAKKIGITTRALHDKLEGATEFKASEIGSISAILGLTPDDINAIFFA